jgi:nitrous oxidase accessory protein NosD
MDSNFILSSSESRFENNLFTAVEGNGLEVQNGEGNIFSFNSFDGNVLGAGGTRGSVGLVLSNSSNNTFFTDQMSGAGYGSIGMSMIDSNDNRFEKAQLSGRIGIYMSRSDANDLLYNVFGAGVATAIEMADSDLNIIVGNIMQGNYSATGFKLISCEGNHFEGNTLGLHSVSGYAIYSNGSSENDFVGNNFLYLGGEVRALALAFDDTGTNHWNSTEGGNHWSDWTAPDDDSDSIVDQPYVLDGAAGATDQLPLSVPTVQ